MSISRPEFERGIARLNGRLIGKGSGAEAHGEVLTFKVPHAGSAVTVTFAPQQGVTLGTSLSLPRAHVTIASNCTDPAAAKAFLEAFDQVFQRGGG